MFSIESLRQFLLEANAAGYASGKQKQWIKEADGSTTIPYLSGDFQMHDNFFGGEPYGGRLVVFFQGKPVWIMVYYGTVKKGIDVAIVYKMLRSALKLMPSEAPFRGPKELVDHNFRYQNSWQGNLNSYSGTETIYEKDKSIYHATYLGGLVDERQGV